MMYNMPNDQNTSLAEKRSVQIAVLIFAICSAIWAAFFTHSYKAAIVYAIIVVCLREFYAKPYSALEEKKSPCFVRVMFVGTQVDTISCKGADSVCCPLLAFFLCFFIMREARIPHSRAAQCAAAPRPAPSRCPPCRCRGTRCGCSGGSCGSISPSARLPRSAG
mgnify:FL=1